MARTHLHLLMADHCDLDHQSQGDCEALKEGSQSTRAGFSLGGEAIGRCAYNCIQARRRFNVSLISAGLPFPPIAFMV
jgi:hypothetical protein